MAVEDLPFPFRLSWGVLIMQSSVQLNFNRLDGLVDKLKNIAQKSVQLGTPVHEAEKSILENLFQMGHAVLSSMFQSVGNGDVGPT